MVDNTESRVFLNPDGYVEIIFIGVQDAEKLQRLIDQGIAFIEEHGPISVLIDGRYGRAGRDARSFSTMLNMGRVPGLQEMIILTSGDANDTGAIHGPGVVTSILTSALGFRPVYISDEVEARARAAHKGGRMKAEG